MCQRQKQRWPTILRVTSFVLKHQQPACHILTCDANMRRSVGLLQGLKRLQTDKTFRRWWKIHQAQERQEDAGNGRFLQNMKKQLFQQSSPVFPGGPAQLCVPLTWAWSRSGTRASLQRDVQTCNLQQHTVQRGKVHKGREEARTAAQGRAPSWPSCFAPCVADGGLLIRLEAEGFRDRKDVCETEHTTLFCWIQQQPKHAKHTKCFHCRGRITGIAR